MSARFVGGLGEGASVGQEQLRSAGIGLIKGVLLMAPRVRGARIGV